MTPAAVTRTTVSRFADRHRSGSVGAAAGEQGEGQDGQRRTTSPDYSSGMSGRAPGAEASLI